MNRNQHIWLSVFFSLALGLLLWKLKLPNLFIYSLPMYPTAILPDFIEPALDPNHRKFFHSKRMFKFLVICLVILLLLASFKSQHYFFWFFGVLGYLLHLIAESLTFKGLPN